MPARTSASSKVTRSLPPEDTWATHAPAKQSACCSLRMVGWSHQPFTRACTAWPNSWASTTPTASLPSLDTSAGSSCSSS